MAYQSWSVVFGEQPSAAKWNILGTNDASFNDGTGIAASAITPEKLLTGTGTSWVWQSWTPTLTNLSGGTLNYAKYIQIGKSVFFRFKYTLAGAGVAGNVSFTAPVTFNSGYTDVNTELVGSAGFLDSGAATYKGTLRWASSTSINIVVENVSGTYNAYSVLSSTVPFTWAVNDYIQCIGFYEAA